MKVVHHEDQARGTGEEGYGNRRKRFNRPRSLKFEVMRGPSTNMGGGRSIIVARATTIRWHVQGGIRRRYRKGAGRRVI